MTTLSGTIHALYSYDVAEAIRLDRLSTMLGPHASYATVYDKAAGAPRVRYIEPPIIVDGDALGEATVSGFPTRLKFYDYGVVSFTLTRAFAADWSDLVLTASDLLENEVLAKQVDDACQRIVDRIADSLDGVRTSFLDEDYLVFAVTKIEPSLDADTLLQRHGTDIAQLVLGERQPLSSQERDESLRHRISYLSDDLVVPAWNAAFVYDREPAMAATLEILEFANSQLLEFRYHDERLESALKRIYADLQHPRWTDRLVGRRHLRATRELHGLFIDVNDLTDHLENALKLVGDVYAARLFSLVATRLGLDRWKRNVQDKLNTLNDIYRFAVEQTRVSQGNILELVIVLILVFELGLTLKGLMGMP
jgi:hypothetical protein